MHLQISAEYLALAAEFVADDFDIRHYLKGVHIEPRNEGACIVATNGHTLCAFHDDRAECTEPVILPVSHTLKGACLPLFSDLNDRFVEYQPELESVIVRVDGAEVVHQEHIEAIDGAFPKWRSVVPKALAPVPAPTTLAPQYVEQFAQVADALMAWHPGLRFYPSEDPTGATLALVSGRRDFLGLIMPMKDESDYALPEWALSPSQA